LLKIFNLRTKKSEKPKTTIQLTNLLTPNQLNLDLITHITSGDRYIRTFVIDGWADEIDFGYLHPLISFDGDIDLIQYIVPVPKKKIISYLNRRIEGIESRLIEKAKWASSRGVRSMKEELAYLDQLRSDIDNNREKIIYFDHHISIGADDYERLESQTHKLLSKFGGIEEQLKACHFEHDLVFKSVSPLAIKRKNSWKEMTLDAGTNLYPFTMSDWPHEKGPLIAINYDTSSPILFDGFNKAHVSNYGISLIGVSGYGKTSMIQKIMAGEIPFGIQYYVIDREHDFKDLIEIVGGTFLEINRHTDLRLNPCDIEEEFNEDRGEWWVDIHSKIEDLTNLTAFMLGLKDKTEDKYILAYIDRAWLDVYAGITEDPHSLYTEAYFDPASGQFVRGKKKRMPRFSDFYHRYCEIVSGIRELEKTIVTLERYTEKGNLGLFDCHSNVDISSAPAVGFGIKELKKSELDPIASMVIMTFIENKFLKKRNRNDQSLFRVVNDEVQEDLANPYTADGIETFFRRFRKRKGGPIAATQNFQRLYASEQGKAIVQNSDTKFIFAQDTGDLKLTSELFGLTEGELEYLSMKLPHHVIIKQPKYSVRAVTVFSKLEQEIFFPEHGG
jgi:type IV secretory pathway VirB4 component